MPPFVDNAAAAVEVVALGFDLDVDEPRPEVFGQRLSADYPRPHEAGVEPAAPVGGPVVS